LVGFNRRFSPHIETMKKHLKGQSEPLALNMTINAGMIPDDHWAHDAQIGGGRIIGEGCHFIDLMVYLTGSLIDSVSAGMMHSPSGPQEDKMSITLGCKDGSVGTINYFANGPKSYPKESLQVFSQGRVMDLNNFRKLKGYGFKGLRTFKTSRQDKGHAAELQAFVKRVENGGDYLIPLEQLVNVSLAAIAATTSAKEKRTIVIDDEYKNVIDLL
jgi:predicted dehydrogenase